MLCKADDKAADSDLCAYIEELREHALYEMPLLQDPFPGCFIVHLRAFFADLRKVHGNDKHCNNNEDACD